MLFVMVMVLLMCIWFGCWIVWILMCVIWFCVRWWLDRVVMGLLGCVSVFSLLVVVCKLSVGGCSLLFMFCF